MPIRSRRQLRLLSAGYLTLDLVVRDLGARDYWQSVGGTCGNVAAFASALGADVTILGRVGYDRRGLELLTKLSSAGVDVAHVERISRVCTPGVVEFIRTDMGSTHRFEYRCPVCDTQLPKAAVVSKRQAKIEAERIDEFDAFFFDRAAPGTVHLARAARDAGLLVIFEPTTVPRTDLAERAATTSDIVKVSQQPSNSMGDWRPNRGATTRFIVETLGSGGTRFRARSQHRWRAWRELPCVAQSNVRDTAGAGDWLTAGVITRLLSEPNTLTDDAMQSAIEYGQRLSAISLSFDGAQGALSVLGAATIRQIASSNSPIEIPRQFPRLRLPLRESAARPAGYCELCLTKVAASRADFRDVKQS